MKPPAVYVKCGIKLICCVVVVNLIFAAALSEAQAACKRKLSTVVLCPMSENAFNCTTESGSFINLVHTRADGPRDTIHFLYSTWGIPSVLVARTLVGSSLNINYTKFLSDSVEETKNSVNFTAEVQSAFVIMLPQLIEYVDTLDTANMEEANYTRYAYNLSNVRWENASVHTLVDQNLVVFELDDKNQEPALRQNGSLALKFRAYCNDDYSSELPNLQYNSNMSLADVVLGNLVTNNKSRFAVQLLLATTSNIGGNMSIQVQKSIDDEHSPGSFATIDWLSGVSANDTEAQTFVQWKPACYSDPVRSIHSLSRSRYYALRPFSFEGGAQRGLAYCYFGDAVLPSGSINMATNDVSFGLPLDGFYIKTPYIAWSFSFGFGNPPTDRISMMIILIIAIGLGIPILLIIGGCIYTCIRKYRHREGYQEITESYSEIN